MRSAIAHILSFVVLIAPKFSLGQIFGLQYREQLFYGTALSNISEDSYQVLAIGSKPGFYPLCKVFKYDNAFQFLDSVELLKGIIPQRNEPLKKNGRLYWPAVYWDTLGITGGALAILELDTFYNHLALHKVNAPIFASLSSVNLTQIGTRYYTAYVKDFTITVVYKLDSQFHILDSTVFNTGATDLHSLDKQIMISMDGNGNYPCPGKSAQILKTVVLDTNLNQTNCFSFDSLGFYPAPLGFPLQRIWIRAKPFNPAKTVRLSDTRFLAVGYGGKPGYQSNPGQFAAINSILDKDFNIVKTLDFTGSDTNTTYLDYTNFVAVQGNKILTVGCIGDNMQHYILQKTKIFVNKIDTNGNVLWKREYGGEMYYRATSIVFTKDNGCLIAGWRYDTTTMNNIHVWESFLLKLDEHGNFNSVGIFENGKLRSNSVKCFPNPGRKTIHLDIPFMDECDLKIKDIFGSQIISIPSYKSRSEIDVSGLTPGTYIYTVASKKEGFSGKFLKVED